MPPALPDLSDCVAVLGHGAGSGPGFLARAFPAHRLGVRECRYVHEATGSTPRARHLLAAAAESVSGPVIIGGVSLGGHAAARLAASPAMPANVAGCLVCLPAWTGAPGPVAAMTATAADAIAVLGIAGALAEFDSGDWVTAELSEAWAGRGDADLAAELRRASTQSAPQLSELRRIPVPVGVVAMADDPLHPASVAASWAKAIPRAGMQVMSRDDPADDRAAFADQGRRALTEVW